MDEKIIHLYKQKKYSELLALLSDAELSENRPERLHVLLESALGAKDQIKLEILFHTSLKFIGTDNDPSTSILCNVLVYLFLPDTTHRDEKINIVRNAILNTELRLLFDHRVNIFNATLEYDIQEYCKLQRQIYNFCANIASSDNSVKYTSLFTQVYRTSTLYKSIDFNVTPKSLTQLNKPIEKKYDVVLSCTRDYFETFVSNIYDLLAQDERLHVHLVFVTRGISHSLTTESCRLTSRLHIYRKFVSPEVDKRQLAVHATIARYEYLWPIMQSTKNDLLILDIDLSFKHINLCSLIDNTQHQQEIMQRFLLSYGSLTADYQSNISAGMLFASTHHCHIYNQISNILASLPKEACLWGIDQALIIQVLAENNIQPATINYLSTISSNHPLWSVDPELQLIKSKLRTRLR